MATIIFVIITIMVSSLALANSCDSLNQVVWLQGQWQANSDKYQVSENWRKISSVTYEGNGQTLSTKTGNMISAETRRLVEMMGGRLSYCQSGK